MRLHRNLFLLLRLSSCERNRRRPIRSRSSGMTCIRVQTLMITWRSWPCTCMKTSVQLAFRLVNLRSLSFLLQKMLGKRHILMKLSLKSLNSNFQTQITVLSFVALTSSQAKASHTTSSMKSSPPRTRPSQLKPKPLAKRTTPKSPKSSSTSSLTRLSARTRCISGTFHASARSWQSHSSTSRH